jgi:hypothetical protein
MTLHTFRRGRLFELKRIGDRGIVLLLGEGRHYTPLSWECLEGIVPFMRRYSGWITAGGTYVTSGETGSLDEHLKNCITRQTSRWVAVVLAEADVVRVDEGPPLRVRLTEAFAR